MPCQAVFNKLNIEEAPKELRDLRRLERVLIAQRILFKKIAILKEVNQNISNLLVVEILLDFNQSDSTGW